MKGRSHEGAQPRVILKRNVHLFFPSTFISIYSSILHIHISLMVNRKGRRNNHNCTILLSMYNTLDIVLRQNYTPIDSLVEGEKTKKKRTVSPTSRSFAYLVAEKLRGRQDVISSTYFATYTRRTEKYKNICFHVSNVSFKNLRWASLRNSAVLDPRD